MTGTTFFSFVEQAFHNLHKTLSQTIALMVMRADGDVLNTVGFHGVLEDVTRITWSIICDNGIRIAIFTEYGIHMSSDTIRCHGGEATHNGVPAHVVNNEEVVLAVPGEQV